MIYVWIMCKIGKHYSLIIIITCILRIDNWHQGLAAPASMGEVQTPLVQLYSCSCGYNHKSGGNSTILTILLLLQSRYAKNTMHKSFQAEVFLLLTNITGFESRYLYHRRYINVCWCHHGNKKFEEWKQEVWLPTGVWGLFSYFWIKNFLSSLHIFL